MGTSTSAAQLSRKLEAVARDIGNTRVPLNATALHVKRLFESSAASAGVLGHRVARGKIGVRYDIRGNGPRAVALVRYVGPAHLANNPTKPHRIDPRRARGSRRRRGARALTIGGNVRAWANHPGTRGKGFFQKAKTAAVATAPRVYARAGLTEPLKRNL
jgi:hypothetical protein